MATVATVLEDAKKAAKNASPGEIYVYLQDPNLPGDVEMDLASCSRSIRKSKRAQKP